MHGQIFLIGIWNDAALGVFESFHYEPSKLSVDAGDAHDALRCCRARALASRMMCSS
jgi:hypothetical protein